MSKIIPKTIDVKCLTSKKIKFFKEDTYLWQTDYMEYFTLIVK